MIMQYIKYGIAVIILTGLMLVSFSPSWNSEKLIKVHYTDLTTEAKVEVDCLAQNIYHEAGFESNEGKQAVAFVTLNRTLDERFPSKICSVVKQKTRRTCQFSWFCLPVKLHKESEAYKQSLEAALFVYANYDKLRDVTEGALFYHADYVRPKWKGLEVTTVIGRHIFYKEGKQPNDAKTKPTAI
jgi:spore germination cell wall hydrolase CwlJ-like protein